MIGAKPVRRNSRDSKTRSAAEDRLTVILTAAAQCFAEQGYEATSLNEIADRVKLNKATLYHYIKGKEAILHSCLLRSFADSATVLARLQDDTQPVLDRLRFFFTHLIHAQNNVFGRCLTMVGPQPLGDGPQQEIRLFQRQLDRSVRDLIQDGMAWGALRADDAGLIAALLFGAFNWVPRWHRAGRSPALDRIASEFLDIALHGIANAPDSIVPLPADPFPDQAIVSAGEDDKLTQILTIAAQCFAEQGYEATALNDIADRVGLHKATLYHYVDSKDAILHQCLLRSFTDYDVVLTRMADRNHSPAVRLQHFFGKLIHAQTNVFGRCLTMVGPEPLGSGGKTSQIRQFQRRLDTAVRSLVTEGIEAGQFRPVDPVMVSALLFGAFNWVPRWYQAAGPASLDDIATAFIRYTLAGLAVRPAV